MNSGGTTITKILVANRGEIAIRVFRACTELNLQTVGIYSLEDRYSLHRYKADQSFLIRGDDPIAPYLDIQGILQIAKESGAQAIHPGYGFLSERADFAQACADNGIIFIGPPPKILSAMGNKVEARTLARTHGLQIIPGSPPLQTLAEAEKFARQVGFPVVLKATYGGGGRGMRVGRDNQALKRFFSEAQNESQKAFGRAEIFLEKYLEKPKHIEVQILGDQHGNICHLLERDCSVQRRYQKIIEFAPAVALPENIRNKIHADAVKLTQQIKYSNAGTVEFLVDQNGQHYFIEMNPRLQVEHTVTEQITGIDLVKAQIRIAMGMSLADIGIQQDKIRTHRFSIQCRITTEDPADQFNPSFGKLVVYRAATGFGVRLDQGNAFTGAVIDAHYDSLLVKLICSGSSFDDACATCRRALAEFRIRGVKTNIPFLENVISHPVFQRGEATTRFIEETPELFQFAPRRDRASKLLNYLANTTVNGSSMVPPTHPARQLNYATPKVPAINEHDAPQAGSRQLLEKLGPEKFVQWIWQQKKLLITDTTFRDAHQSLLATRMRTYDMLRIAPVVARHAANLFSLEMWGGATFDVALRFLRENPWNRLKHLREQIPNICFQMLLRGSNAVGYTSYSDNVVREFTLAAAEHGIDIFRIFDSLNWPEQMQIAIDAVREANKLAEVAICYTGDLNDPAEKKYARDYYLKLAKELQKRGAHLLALKDMAGLLRPAAATKLIRTLREETGLPVHLHTHDTAGIQAATYWQAAAVGVDIVDCAFGAMSGLTSQPNLESVVAMFANTERATDLALNELNPISDYWEEVRKIYAPFESGLLSGSAQVYEHEMPGGQYANLRVQATSLGLEEHWADIKKTYAQVNKLLGNIVKVTPSSKVVGDLALYLVSNNLTVTDVLEKGDALSFPQSLIDLLSGKLGQPYGSDGWPQQLVSIVLKGKTTEQQRPGALLEPLNLDTVLQSIPQIPSREVKPTDALSKALYPQVFAEYLKHRFQYGDVSFMPSAAFFYGLKENQEIAITIEPGKTLLIKLVAVSEKNAKGWRTVFFELNGMSRAVQVFDESSGVKRIEHQKADPQNANHVGASIPGKLTKILVKETELVQKNQPLCVLEAMKMEATILAPRKAKIAKIHLAEGTKITSGDLLFELIKG